MSDPVDAHREKLRQNPHSVFPLCDGSLDLVLGVVRSTRLLDQVMDGRSLDLRALAEPALFVPETMTLMKLLEQFKRTHLSSARRRRVPRHEGFGQPDRRDVFNCRRPA
jgi:putative hemolysin